MFDERTVLIYSNAATPQLANSPWLPTFFRQLNGAAAYLVSRRARWHLVDSATISDGYLDRPHYLNVKPDGGLDGLHPNNKYGLMILNIFLNIHDSVVRSRGQRSAEPIPEALRPDQVTAAQPDASQPEGVQGEDAAALPVVM